MVKFNKIVIVFVVVQILLIVLLITVFVQRKEINDETTVLTTIYVDKTKYIPSSGRHSQFYICSNNLKYSIVLKLAQKNGYPANDLKNILDKKTISISFINKKTIYGNKNEITSISIEDELIYSISDYNKEQKSQRITGIIVVSIFEVLFLFIVGAYMFFKFKLS